MADAITKLKLVRDWLQSGPTTAHVARRITQCIAELEAAQQACPSCDGTGTIEKTDWPGEHANRYQEPCPSCGGKAQQAEPPFIQCACCDAPNTHLGSDGNPRCDAHRLNGDEKRARPQQSGLAQQAEPSQPCPNCKGTGKEERMSFQDHTKTITNTCHACRGKGTLGQQAEPSDAEIDAWRRGDAKLREAARAMLVAGDSVSGALNDIAGDGHRVYLDDYESAEAALRAALGEQ